VGTEVAGAPVEFGQKLTISSLAALLIAVCCSARSTVGPDDRLYPRPNSQAGHVIEVQIAAPSSLRVRVEALYRAVPETARGAHDDCQHTIGLGVTAPLEVLVPLEFTRNGEAQTVKVIADKFEPGYCKWYFGGLRYRMLSGTPTDEREIDGDQARTVTGLLAATVENSTVSWLGFKPPDKATAYQGSVDLWCAEHPLVSNGGGPPQCDNWFHATLPLRNGAPIDPTRNDPGSGRADETTTIIFPDTKVVTIHFHDLEKPGF
jgi:hypothetical protein